MIALLVGVMTLCTIVALAGQAPSSRVPGLAEVPTAPPGLSTVIEGLVARLEHIRPERRRGRRDAQLPDALDRLASSLRSGRSVGPALVELAGDVAEPLGSELRVMADSLAHGAAVAVALARWAASPESSADVRLVAAALTLGADAGGEVARAVDRIAATLRERSELHAEVQSLATQARASAGVLALAPLAFAGLVATIEPKAVAFLVTTPIGWACLSAGLGLEAIGATWMARITGRAA